MKVKDICQLIYDKYSYKGGPSYEFSIPFISKYNGKDYVTFFMFEIIENEDNIQINNIVKKIFVEYETGEIIEQSISFDSDSLPIVLNNTEELYYEENENTYYDTIDFYFENIANYNRSITKIIPKDMKELYNSLGTKFLNK